MSHSSGHDEPNGSLWHNIQNVEHKLELADVRHKPVAYWMTDLQYIALHTDMFYLILWSDAEHFQQVHSWYTAKPTYYNQLSLLVM